jgi:hypothetical protein
VLHRFFAAPFCDQGLGEAETKHFVSRISRHQRAEVIHP